MSIYTDALKRYAAAQQEATSFSHPDYTHNGINRERTRRLAAARDNLVKSFPPAEVADPAKVEEARTKALATLAVTTADQAVLVDRQWPAVQRMLDSGRPIQNIIAGASQARLAAILDHLESDIAPVSIDPEGTTPEIQDLVLDRAAELGISEAADHAKVAGEVAYHSAWQGIVQSVLSGQSSQLALSGSSSLAAQSALFHVAPDEATEVAEVFSDPEFVSGQDTARHLDSIAANSEAVSA